MTREQRAELAIAERDRFIPNDAVHAVIRKLNPAVHETYTATGSWGEDGAPYEVRRLDDGRRQVRVQSADGDLIAGVGPTVADAVHALCKKTGVAIPNAATE